MIIQLNYNNEDAVITFAAKELGEYLSRMLPCTIRQNGSGSEADLRISLSTRSEEKHDQFRIDMQRQNGYILGSNSRSVLLGVYHYLHTLGCRFPAPGKKYEIIPAITEDCLYISYAKSASFDHRGACIEGANSLENVLDFVDWLPKLGYNSFFLQFSVPYTFLARWYNHENNPFAWENTDGANGAAPADAKPADTRPSKKPYTLEDAVSHTAVIESAMAQRGLLLHKVGHGWTGKALGFSSVAWQAEDRPLTAAQREITAQLHGVRDLFCHVPLNTNLCYSNPRAVDTFVKAVTDYAGEHPEVSCLHIWLADDCNNVCECDECRKSTPSDQYIHLLNRIDEALTAKHIQTKLVFLLYLELLWPPVKERLHNPDRFILMFAPISRTFEASYDLSQKLPPIPPYRRNHISLPSGLTENLSFLQGWQKTFSGDSFVYDYHLGRAHYGDLGYVHISRIASEDIKKLREMGLNGMISCQELRAGMPNWLPNYVMGHTLFDEELSFDQLVKEYYQAAYGKDYQTVIDYLSKLSELGSCDYMNGKGPRENPSMAERFQEILKTADEFLTVIDAHRIPLSQGAADEGETDAPACNACAAFQYDSPFWRLLSYHRQYVLLLGKALYYMANGENKNASQSWNAFREYICRMEPYFQEALDVYRVTEITGNHAGLKRLSQDA